MASSDEDELAELRAARPNRNGNVVRDLVRALRAIVLFLIDARERPLHTNNIAIVLKDKT